MAWKDFWNRLWRSSGTGEQAPERLPPVDKKRLVRRRIYFSGEVQGVGFRYRCMNHANDLGVTGFAQNLLDGRVRAEFQSDEAHIQALITRMEREPWVQIEHMEVTERPVEIGEKGFQVDYF